MRPRLHAAGVRPAADHDGNFNDNLRAVNAPVAHDVEFAKSLAATDVERVFRSELTDLCAQLSTFPSNQTY